MADNFPPGASGMLIYTDEHGFSRSSLVEVVRENPHAGTTWYVVVGRQDIFSKNHLAVPMERTKIDVKEGHSVALVPENNLAPVGTRLFRIVQ